MIGVVDITSAWKKDEMILAAVNKDEKIVNKKDVISEQIYNLYVIGKEKKYSQIYFDIATINGIMALIMHQEERIKREKIQLSLKKTISYYTTKIGFIAGPNLKYGSANQYKNAISKKCMSGLG